MASHIYLILTEYFKTIFPKELIQFITKLRYELLPIKIKITKSSCILLCNNNVYVWGNNEYNQLGLGESDINIYHSPQKLNLKNIIQIDCAYSSFYAINDHNEIYSWGINKHGNLGLGHYKTQYSPRKINLKGVIKMYCMYSHAECITKNGNVYTWEIGCISSYDTSPRKLDIRNIKKFICGMDHAIALNKFGEVYYWTKDGPHKLNIINVKQISCYGSDCLILTQLNEIYTWGNNDNGQLGLGHNNPVRWDKPEKINLNVNIKKIYCKNRFSYAITYSGEVYLWGDLEYFGCYYEEILVFDKDSWCSLPIKMELTNVKDIRFGKTHLIALYNSGQVYISGLNHRLERIDCGTLLLRRIKKIQCNDNYSLAITYDNEIFIWGKNDNGELGVGHNKNVTIPTKIIIPY